MPTLSPITARASLKAPTVALVLATTSLSFGVAACGEARLNFDERRPDGTQTSVNANPKTTLGLKRAVSRRVATCMRGKGWAYSVPAIEDDGLVIPPYGLDDVRFRRQYGAGALPGRDGSPVPLTNDEDGSAGGAKASDAEAGSGKVPATPDEQAAFDADLSAGQSIEVPLPQGGTVVSLSGGCVGAAQRAVYGDDLKTWFRVSVLVDNLETIVEQSVFRDAEFRGLMADWRACMEREGFSVAPSTREPAEGAELTDAFAVADATCGDRLGVARAGVRIATVKRREIEAKYTDDILAYNELETAAKRRLAKG